MQIKKLKPMISRSIKKIIAVAVIAAAAYIISQNYVQLVLVRGNSMEPAFHDGQIVIINKMYDEIKTGDVVVFWC